MSATDIAAWIGGGGTLFQVAERLAKYFIKPTLNIISAPTVTVGYSDLGPVVFLTVSISAEKKDALIEKISLTATHEKGDSRMLTWTWLTETPFQVAVPTGETMDFQKSQAAVALKVSTLTLTEKVIWFQDKEWLKNHRQIYAKLTEQLNYLKDQAGNQPSSLPGSLERSREFKEELQFFRDNMYWREGQYTFRVSLKEISLGAPYTKRFSVSLLKAAVDVLRKNDRIFEQQLLSFAAGAGFKPVWNFAYPEIEALD